MLTPDNNVISKSFKDKPAESRSFTDISPSSTVLTILIMETKRRLSVHARTATRLRALPHCSRGSCCLASSKDVSAVISFLFYINWRIIWNGISQVLNLLGRCLRDWSTHGDNLRQVNEVNRQIASQLVSLQRSRSWCDGLSYLTVTLNGSLSLNPDNVSIFRFQIFSRSIPVRRLVSSVVMSFGIFYRQFI